MCGIAGIFSLKRNISPEWVQGMTDILKHRGPDDEGFLAVNTNDKKTYPLVGNDRQVDELHINSFKGNANLLLGHRRLSIIDLSPLGHQPMPNKDKSIWVIYNGEIYNYVELREELKASGYEFITHTDTEVLLAAYEEWGDSCLNKFNGMWAFVIYDKRKNMLFGSRDRFGVKPFYYHRNEHYFSFASEIKALLKLPFIRVEMNKKAVFDYLVLSAIENEEESFFKDIYELFPGHAFTLDLSDNTLKIYQYYRLPYNSKFEQYNEKNSEEYVNEIRELIYQAIAVRLRSDVPIGSCLSGGLDSSSIVCVINELLRQKKSNIIGDRQKVFTVCNENKKEDESSWAGIVAGQTRTEWHRSCSSPEEMLADMEDVVYTQDIPFYPVSVMAQYALMKIVKRASIKVLMDGQGGDEVFAGYKGFYLSFLRELIGNMQIKDSVREIRTLHNSPVKMKYLLGAYLKIYGPRFLPSSLIEKILIRKKTALRYLNPHFLDEHSVEVSKFRERSVSLLNKTLHSNICGHEFKYLLRYEDRNSMRFSIEARTPFADDINLIEYVFSVPASFKIHNGWSKYLMREAMKGILPEEVRQRRDKVGFATMESIWLPRIKDEFLNYLSPQLKDILNIDLLKNDWDFLFHGASPYATHSLWQLILFAIWAKVFKV